MVGRTAPSPSSRFPEIQPPRMAEAAPVNTEAGLDYWLPGEPHQELQHVQDGGHQGAGV